MVEALGHREQDDVARVVAVGVVDGFEVVDVRQGDHGGQARGRDLCGVFFEAAAVGERGQGVVPGVGLGDRQRAGLFGGHQHLLEADAEPAQDGRAHHNPSGPARHGQAPDGREREDIQGDGGPDRVPNVALERGAPDAGW